MVLPAYIILSAIFILYVAYSYLQWVVYRSGAANWQQQWYSLGQQEWYTNAVIEVINSVSEKCEPVAITAWEAQVDVINVACLQAQKPAPITSTWSESQ